MYQKSHSERGRPDQSLHFDPCTVRLVRFAVAAVVNEATAYVRPHLQNRKDRTTVNATKNPCYLHRRSPTLQQRIVQAESDSSRERRDAKRFTRTQFLLKRIHHNILN